MSTAEKLSEAVDLLKSWGFDASITEGAVGGKPFAAQSVLNYSGLNSLGNFSVDTEGKILLGTTGHVAHSGMGNVGSEAQINKGIRLGTRLSPGPLQPHTADHAVGVSAAVDGTWGPAQRNAVVALNAALVRVFGWNEVELPVAGGKEFSRNRANEPKDDMAAIRLAVVKALKAAPEPLTGVVAPPAPEPEPEPTATEPEPVEAAPEPDAPTPEPVELEVQPDAPSEPEVLKEYTPPVKRKPRVKKAAADS